MPRGFIIVGVYCVLVGALAQGAISAEIVVRSEARPAGALVRLGDVADVFTDDVAQRRQLADLELFPTPAVGAKRFVRVRELLDLLNHRGVNLALHRVSGQSVVEVSSATPVAVVDLPPLTTAQERQANEAVRTALARYLTQQLPDENGWMVEVKLSPEQARQVLSSVGKLTAQGGAAPWVGGQRFQVSTAGATAGPLSIDAQVTLPPAVVVAVRSIGKQTVVQREDVELQRGIKAARPASELVTRIEDVVGRETTRSLAAGQYLEQDHIRQPLSVRRGDVVTVYARSAGLRVRTTARAKDDGSVGDLIAVDSLLNKQSFFARVSGIQEVEVFAHGIDASGSANAAANQTATKKAAANNTARQPAAPPATQQSNVAAQLLTSGGAR